MCDGCEFRGYQPGSALILAANRVAGLLRSVSTLARPAAPFTSGKWNRTTQHAGRIVAVIALCTWIVVGLSLVVSASQRFPFEAPYSIALGSLACVTVVAGLTRPSFATWHLRTTGTFVSQAIVGCLVFLAFTAMLFDGAQGLISITR